LRRGSYDEHAGDCFHAELGDGRTVSLQLDAVRDRPRTTASGGTRSAVLRTRSYSSCWSLIRRASLGGIPFDRHSLFVVRQAPPRNGSTYAAVVNRGDR